MDAYVLRYSYLPTSSRLTYTPEGIQVVSDKAWITKPAAVSGVSDTVTTAPRTCDEIAGAAFGPTQTQMGSGSDDGPYVHQGAQIASFNGFTNPSTINFNNPLPEGVYWADINGVHQASNLQSKARCH